MLTLLPNNSLIVSCLVTRGSNYSTYWNCGSTDAWHLAYGKQRCLLCALWCTAQCCGAITERRQDTITELVSNKFHITLWQEHKWSLDWIQRYCFTILQKLNLLLPVRWWQPGRNYHVYLLTKRSVFALICEHHMEFVSCPITRSGEASFMKDWCHFNGTFVDETLQANTGMNANNLLRIFKE
jgi:hypothetical protein